MGRAADHNPLHVHQDLGGDVRRGQFFERDAGQIDRALPQLGEQGAGGPADDREVDAFQLVPGRGERPRDVDGFPRRNGADPDNSFPPVQQRVDLGERVLILELHGARPAGKQPAVCGQLDAGGPAMEEGDPDAVFEHPDASGQRGLRNIELGRGLGYPALVGNRQEVGDESVDTLVCHWSP